MRYLPGQVWSILVNGSDDLDEVIDIRQAMHSLTAQEQTFLTLLASGQTGKYAMHEARLRGNQTTLKQRCLTRMAAVLDNGESE